MRMLPSSTCNLHFFCASFFLLPFASSFQSVLPAWTGCPQKVTSFVPGASGNHSFRNKRASSVAAKVSTADLRDRLGLHDRFDRWRFLQQLLAQEATPEDTNRVLYAVLEGYIKFPRPKYAGTDETGSPELSSELFSLIEELLDDSNDGRISALLPVGPDEDSCDEKVLDRLEKLLPDLDEDEDAFKGLWDTVMELHGREAVKIDSGEGCPLWRACSLIARVLIHFDFLSYGLVDSPIR